MINFKSYEEPIVSFEYTNRDYETEGNDDDYCKDIILFKTAGGHIFKLQAFGDCCSVSEFIPKYENENKDMSFIINKIIVNIEEIELPEDFEAPVDKFSCNDHTTPHLYEISFKETEETYKFLMFNYSNGYYDGWIEANVI